MQLVLISHYVCDLVMCCSQLPHGLVFAGFMICVMIGSRMFSSLTQFQSVESLCRIVFVIATFAIGAPILFPVRCLFQSLLAVFVLMVCDCDCAVTQGSVVGFLCV